MNRFSAPEQKCATVRDFFANPDCKMVAVVKKGKKYVGEKNGELALTANLQDAMAFPDWKRAAKIMEVAAIDTRNARVLGKKYNIVDIHRR